MKRQSSISIGCGLVLLGIWAVPAIFTLWTRIDTVHELTVIRIWDVLLGLLFAAAILLLVIGNVSIRSAFLTAALAWVLVSGFFLLLHESQVRVRWTVPDRVLALNSIKMVEVALHDYAIDCSGFPGEKGQSALRTNPGVDSWSGPYLEIDAVSDPWGNPIQWSARGVHLKVWSNGPDGRSGTDDDIWLDSKLSN